MPSSVTREVIFDPLDRIRIAAYSQLDGWLDLADGTGGSQFGVFDTIYNYIHDDVARFF